MQLIGGNHFKSKLAALVAWFFRNAVWWFCLKCIAKAAKHFDTFWWTLFYILKPLIKLQKMTLQLFVSLFWVFTKICSFNRWHYYPLVVGRADSCFSSCSFGDLATQTLYTPGSLLHCDRCSRGSPWLQGWRCPPPSYWIW